MALVPDFIEINLEVIIDEMVLDYEQRTGKILQPADVERLLINAFGYRELLIRTSIQEAASQNLVEFSTAPVLDYLGEIVGVYRLAETSATVNIDFSLVSGHGGVTIPQGTRISTSDNLAVFRTTIAHLVPAGVDAVSVVAESVTGGPAGNGYALGTITEILDPQAFLSSAINSSISGGGASQETDEAMRQRIKLAPGSFSNAGSRRAYEFFATSANPSIIDVAVLGPESTPPTPPGEVHIYPLMNDGSVTPGTVLDEVYAAVNSEKVRPLTDLVIVASPTRIDYSIVVDVVVYDTADTAAVEQQITEALESYTLAKRQTLGQDVLQSQIIGVSYIPGQVYNVASVLPIDIIVNSTSFAYCNSITVNVIGSNNG